MSDQRTTSDKSQMTHESTSFHVTVTLNHPRLLSFDPSSIRMFLRNYDSYSRTIIARAKRLTAHDTTSEIVLPAYVKYCVDVQLLKSTIELGFIPDFSSYDCLLYTSPSPRDQRGSRMPSSA